jgi:hypothetical protein
MQQVFAPVGGDAPRDQQGLLGTVAAQRLKDRIDEQVLHGDVGQVAGGELLIVLPEPVGDLADRAFGDEHLPGGVAEGVLHVPGGQPPRIHLADQPLQHLGVAVQKAHQARPERLTNTTDLRDCDTNRALRGAHPARLIPVTPADLTFPAAFIAASAAQEITLLTFDEFLHH